MYTMNKIAKALNLLGIKTFSTTMNMMNGMDKGVGILVYRVYQVHQGKR